MSLLEGEDSARATLAQFNIMLDIKGFLDPVETARYNALELELAVRTGSIHSFDDDDFVPSTPVPPKFISGSGSATVKKRQADCVDLSESPQKRYGFDGHYCECTRKNGLFKKAKFQEMNYHGDRTIPYWVCAMKKCAYDSRGF